MTEEQIGLQDNLECDLDFAPPAMGHRWAA